MAPADLGQRRAGRNTEGVISMSTTTRLPHTSSAFLTAWWGDTPIAPILIWTNPGRRSHWLRDSKEADRDWGKRNVYTGVALPPEGKDLRHDHRVVPGSVGSYRPVIAGAKLREGTTTILPRGGERSRESPCLQCGFTPLAGDTRTMKTDKKGALRLQTHLLSDRPAIEWPCRT